VATPLVNPMGRISAGHRPSAASMVVWLALASDTDTIWAGRRMVHRGSCREDVPFCPVYGQAFGGGRPPEWISDGVSAVDASLPPASLLLGALSPRDLVLPLDPAAARIPASPELADAAACLLACRMVLACAAHAVPPAFADREEALRNVADASFLAAAAVGHEIVPAAVRMASNRHIFTRIEEALPEWLETEDQDGQA